ncbi:MAG: peptidylprolyl isomerase [Ruminococcaceae bacterium]|nr:peptidylprolyl isomerase [Oscillospiraceae bacterium]
MNEEKVLASVGGKNITEQDVTIAIMQMGQRGQNYNNPQGRAMVLEQLIAQKLFLMDATRNLYEREPAFKEQLQRVKEEMLTSYAVQKAVERVSVTEADAKKYYEENQDKFVSGMKFNADHILVETKEKAEEILAKINAGEISFADAAAAESTCPSGQNGGSLGDFSAGQMVPEFENACAAMEIGAVSEPVQTQFGFHLIKLNNKEDGGIMKYEDVKNELMEALKGEKQQAAYQSKLNQLKILYPVDKF